MKQDKSEDIIVSTKVIADILDVTTRRVRQMCEEGILTRYKDGAFQLVPTMRAYITYLKIKHEAKQTAPDNPEQQYLIEHARLEKAKREKAEIQVSLMKGTVHAAEDVERELTKMLLAFRAKILGIPSRLAPRITNINEANQLEEMIRQELYEALQELSDYDPDTFKHATTVDDQEEE